MIPGEYILAEGDIECNEGRPTVNITVVNTGDRPVQVGSHFHFFEVNRQMTFDRQMPLACASILLQELLFALNQAKKKK